MSDLDIITTNPATGRRVSVHAILAECSGLSPVGRPGDAIWRRVVRTAGPDPGYMKMGCGSRSLPRLLPTTGYGERCRKHVTDLDALRVGGTLGAMTKRARGGCAAAKERGDQRVQDVQYRAKRGATRRVFRWAGHGEHQRHGSAKYRLHVKPAFQAGIRPVEARGCDAGANHTTSPGPKRANAT